MEDRSHYNWDFIVAGRENEFVIDGMEGVFPCSTSYLSERENRFVGPKDRSPTLFIFPAGRLNVNVLIQKCIH